MKNLFAVMLCVAALACGDDSAKKTQNNNTSNNGANNTSNNGANNTVNHSTSNNGNNATNNGQADPVWECQDASSCEGRMCLQIAVSAAYCALADTAYIADPCPMDEAGNACCSDSDCTEGVNGRCLSSMVGYCGGIPPIEVNVCRYDECQTGNDCGPNEACALAGTFGRPTNTCIPALCYGDGDCTDDEGGKCGLMHSSDTCPVPVLGCTYAGATCRASWQCPNNLLCVNGECIPELQTP